MFRSIFLLLVLVVTNSFAAPSESSINPVFQKIGLQVVAGSPTPEQSEAAALAVLELWAKANLVDWSKDSQLISEDGRFVAILRVSGDSPALEVTDKIIGASYRHDASMISSSIPEPEDNSVFLKSLFSEIDKGIEKHISKPEVAEQLIEELRDVVPSPRASEMAFADDIYELYKRGLDLLAQGRSNFKGSDKEFITKVVDLNKLEMKLSGAGSVEIKAIDGQPVIRAVSFKNRKSYMFIPTDVVPRNSKHLLQYIGRQHFESGSTKISIKPQSGRDVVVIWTDRLELYPKEKLLAPDKVQEFPKLSLVATEYWKDYWRSVYKGPMTDHIVFGLLCGGTQFALAAAAMTLKYYNGQTPMIDLSPAYLSLAWGSVIGAYISTYKNIMNTGTPSQRWMKNFLNSYAFGFILMGLVNPEGFEGLFHLDWRNFWMQAGIIGNVAANSLAKTYWYGFAIVRDQARMTSYNVNLPMFNSSASDFEKLKASMLESGNSIQNRIAGRMVFDSEKQKVFLKTNIKRSDIENQLWYMPAFFIRLLDYIGISVGGYPVGTMLLWGTIPLVEYANLKYTQHIAKISGVSKPEEVYQQLNISWQKKIRFLWSTRLKELILTESIYRMTGKVSYLLGFNTKFAEANYAKRAYRDQKYIEFPDLYPNAVLQENRCHSAFKF